MKFTTSLFTIFIITLFFAGSLQAQEAPKRSYIGVDGCVMCHRTEKQGKQHEIWKNSAHARAYQTLTTAKADSIAKAKGFDTPAVKTENCLKCHTSGYNVDPALLGKRFKIEDGVQCETCHGAGSDYKDMKIMRSREESIKHGMIFHEKLEDYCTVCHNPESPTHKEINFKEAWEPMKHLVPKAK
ncbi:MAG: cytochrome C554 [Chlorobiaceae bacterium]|nr:cytochrome C554 [Chlorobiaceae bacterium]